MKKIIIALLAVIPLSQGAELVADLRLDGNFNDSKGNLSFASNNSERYDRAEVWPTDVVVRDSTRYVSVADDDAAWNGTFAAGTAPSTTSFAISLFVNAAELPTVAANSGHPDWVAQWIFGGGASGNGLPKIGIDQYGQIKVSCHNVGGGINSGTSHVITANNWYQIGVSLTDSGTANKSVWTLYINGERVATSEVATPNNIGWSKVSLFEGADQTGNGRFDGYVDDIQIYNVTGSNDGKQL